MKHFDFVIVGSGIAGLSLALRVAKFGTVAMVTKRNVADSNTAWAQGGVAAVTSAEDSFDLHVKDTLIAGGGLCDPDVVRSIVADGYRAVRDLVDDGARFDEASPGQWSLTREGGHSRRRIIHA